MKTVDITDLQKLDAFAAQMAQDIQTPCVLTLKGDLGAGKTTFCQYLLKHLGVKSHIPSPSYTIMNEYQTDDYYIVHADFYRLDSEDSLELLGWDLIQQKADIILVEWPKDFMDHVDIELQFNDQNKRTVTIIH